MLDGRFRVLEHSGDAPFTDASAGIDSANAAFDAFTRAASVKDAGVEDTLRALLSEVARVERHGFTERELAAAKADVAAMYEDYAAGEATDQSRDFAEEVTRNFLEGEALPGHVKERELALAALPAITADEVRGVLATFGGDASRAIVVEGPGRGQAPEQGAHRGNRRRGRGERARRLEGRDRRRAAHRAPADARQNRRRAEHRRHRRDRVDARQRRPRPRRANDFEADEVALAGSSPGGLGTVDDPDVEQASDAEALLAVGGVGTLDSDALTRALAGKSASANTFIGDTTEGVSADGAARDLETMLELV